jgi:hypothetical protein
MPRLVYQLSDTSTAYTISLRKDRQVSQSTLVYIARLNNQLGGWGMNTKNRVANDRE